MLGALVQYETNLFLWWHLVTSYFLFFICWCATLHLQCQMMRRGGEFYGLMLCNACFSKSSKISPDDFHFMRRLLLILKHKKEERWLKHTRFACRQQGSSANRVITHIIIVLFHSSHRSKFNTTLKFEPYIHTFHLFTKSYLNSIFENQFSSAYDYTINHEDFMHWSEFKLYPTCHLQQPKKYIFTFLLPGA